jgi:hypothetical protein
MSFCLPMGEKLDKQRHIALRVPERRNPAPRTRGDKARDYGPSRSPPYVHRREVAVEMPE